MSPARARARTARSGDERSHRVGRKNCLPPNQRISTENLRCLVQFRLTLLFKDLRNWCLLHTFITMEHEHVRNKENRGRVTGMFFVTHRDFQTKTWLFRSLSEFPPSCQIRGNRQRGNDRYTQRPHRNKSERFGKNITRYIHIQFSLYKLLWYHLLVTMLSKLSC